MNGMTFSPALAAIRSGLFLVLTLVLVPPYVLAYGLGSRPRRAVSGLWFRIVARLTGVRLRMIGSPTIRHSTLYVANHVSYLDIVVLGRLLDVRFVAKSEVAGWLGFGWLARLGRTVFVERRPRRARAQRDAMTACLKAGDSLLLFPEGTSSDGTRVLPFKSALFAAAERIDGLAVQPISLAYGRNIDGRPLTPEQRDRFAWHGDMSLTPHLWTVFGLSGVEVTVRFLPPVTSRPGLVCRKDLAMACQRVVTEGLAEDLGRIESILGRLGEPVWPSPPSGYASFLLHGDVDMSAFSR